MVSYEEDHGHMIMRATDNAPLHTGDAELASSQAVKFLCNLSEAPGDKADRLAQALSWHGEGALNYAKIGMRLACQDGG